ncbi:MAG: N-methyl-L-tryptophan oxidase [Phycisphaerae bacterium]
MQGDHFDDIVLGVGAMGSAACVHLARRGRRVLGLEQFDIAHDQGSSHGRSRVIRKAYFEDPRYVPLLLRAYDLWRELETDWVRARPADAEPLLHITGGLNIGPPSHPAIAGVLASVQQHELAHERLSAADVCRRHPALQPAPDDVAIFEADAGFVLPEAGIRAHAALARLAGADIRTRQRVTAVSIDAAPIRVATASGEFTAERLIIAGGAWLPALAPGLFSLRVERQVQFWFQPREPALFTPARLPVFIHFLADRSYYGIPATGGGVKVCRHHGGATVTPESVDRVARPADEADVRAYLRAHLPAADGPLLDALVCLYTHPPDENFILGPHPRNPRVLIAGGFSGHGYKFAPVIGEILADLATDARTRHDIRLFDPRRPAVAG